MLNIIMPQKLIQLHIDAVMNRLNKSYQIDTVLNDITKLGVESIEDFLKADVDTLRSWVNHDEDKLQLGYFKEIYSKYFSNGSNVYVDKDYNAYKFLELLDVTVCPYCDDEYLSNDLTRDTGKHARTSEVDHFFPKSKYPALAMCIYNLVPSGQNCNGLKKESLIGENPYEKNIEDDTWLYPDLAIGKLMDTVDPEDCRINFHPENGMQKNVSVLCLEDRYGAHKDEVYKILKNKQLFTEEKIKELARIMNISTNDVYESIFGSQDPAVQRRELHRKMKKDLLG